MKKGLVTPKMILGGPVLEERGTVFAARPEFDELFELLLLADGA